MLGKYTQFEPTKVDNAVPGQSSTTLLRKLFNTPTRVYDEATILKTATTYLLAGDDTQKGVQQGDPAQFREGVNLNYAGAPDITKVVTGGGGLPSTPYTPNLTSPGEKAGVNPSGQADMKVENLTELNRNAKEDTDGLVNPATTTLSVSSTKLEQGKNPWQPGKHPGSV